MRISEIFYSIPGEGRFLGMPSVFVRTSGCNLPLSLVRHALHFVATGG